METKEPKRKVLGKVKRYVQRSSHLLQRGPDHGHAAPPEVDVGTFSGELPGPGFDALPAELVVGILGWVAGPRELAAAGGTCRAWYAASLEQALWRRLFFKAKRERRLENVLVENDDIIPLLNNVSLGDPNSSPRHSVDGGDEEEGHDESEVHVTGAGVLVDWRARYKATYDVPKGERKRDTIVVRLDNTVFTAAGALDPPVTGEVVLNVVSSRIVTHGIYVVVSGKEFHSAGAGRYQRTVRSSIFNVALCVSDDVQFSHRHERKVVYEHGTHRLPFCVTPRGLSPPTFCRTAPQLHYSVSYKLRAVIAYPRLHTDYWTSKHAHRLTVLPKHNYELSLLASQRQVPGRSVTSFLNGLVKVTLSLQRTGFLLGEPIQMQVEVDNNSPVDFHFLVVSAVEQMRSPVLCDTFTTVTLPRHDRKQRMRERMAKSTSGEYGGGGGGEDGAGEHGDEDDGNHDAQHDEQAGEEGTTSRRGTEDDGEHHRPDGNVSLRSKQKGPEKWFAAEMLKGQRSTHNVEFTINEEDTNGPPWNIPYSAYVEQRYVIHVKIRRKEGRSLLLGALEPSADSSPVIFVAPPAE